MEVGLAVIDAKKDSLSKRFSAPLYRSQLSQNPFEDTSYFFYYTAQNSCELITYTKCLNLREFPNSHNCTVETALVKKRANGRLVNGNWVILNSISGNHVSGNHVNGNCISGNRVIWVLTKVHIGFRIANLTSKFFRPHSGVTPSQKRPPTCHLTFVAGMCFTKDVLPSFFLSF